MGENKELVTTPWYYDSYEPGTFPCQQKLCKFVEWTVCNLEGQTLVPTILTRADGTKTNTYKLTGQVANPLTIRLLALREALAKLETNVNPIKDAIRQYSEKKFSRGKMFGMGGKLETQDSSIVTGGAPVEVIKIQGKRKPIEWHCDTAHLALYEFFTNFGSILDRLTYEVNMLYDLGIPKKVRYWSKLTDKTYLEKLKNEKKDEALADLLKEYRSNFKGAIRYRNRMVHDGVIRVDLKSPILRGFNVMLAQDPNNDKSDMNVNAIQFCGKVKSDVLSLLDGSYKHILEHINTHGNPPWYTIII